ncbi:MAG: DedA family protein, partial [Deltaproteobacteria bacterium]
LTYLNRQMKRYGHNYLLFLRVIPVIPFCVVNYLAGVTKIPLKIFILATSLGVLPGSLFLTYAGKHLSTANKVGDLLSFSFYLALSGIAIAALLPILISRRKKPAE